MSKVAIIFFENQKQNWSRFPKLISKNIFFEDKYFVYNIGNDKIESSFFTGVFKFNGNCKEIIPILNRYEKIIVVLMSYRLIDIIFYNFLLNNHCNVKGISIQHGIYSDILVRTNMIQFLSVTWKRIISYLMSILFYPYITNFQKISIILHSKKVYYDSKLKLKNSSINKHMRLPENVFIIDKNWEKYFLKNYYSKKPNFFIIPSIDDELKNNPEILPKSSVVIIIQSMVEDGRYSREIYINEINLILNSIDCNKRIYLKLHPRSDMSLYQNLNKKVIFKKNFIVGEHVISSYSSLMKTYYEFGSLVFKWNFIDHHVPKVFSDYCHSEGREDELKSFILRKNRMTIKKEKVNISRTYSDLILKI